MSVDILAKVVDKRDERDNGPTPPPKIKVLEKMNTFCFNFL